ncbi:MAG: hydroxymethylglutaryl-CoA lyase [Fimbriimonas sp.]
MIPTEAKAAFVRDLRAAGLSQIEVTSFVSPKWVPQLADAEELFAYTGYDTGFSALVPNLRGLGRALDSGVERIALFTAASESFARRNINMSIAESVEASREVITAFRSSSHGGHVRVYISTAFECPYEGRIAPGQVVTLASQLADLGVDEIAIGDTLGVASPREVRVLAKEIIQALGEKASMVAWHFHDTRGTAIANVTTCLDLGAFSAFDSSAGGLGGCPYAPGAGGNLATEDLVYFLEREGMATGIDLSRLARASLPILAILGRQPSSKVQVAALAEAG